MPYDFERMKLYAAAGHSIGNHSHTHPDLHRVGVQEFLVNVRTADEILRTLPGYTKWFRFPFLREGKTVAERDAVRLALKEMGYGAAYVTVDTYEWYMDILLQEAVAAGKTVDFDLLGDAYVDLMSESIEFYDRVAQQTLGRSPKHVLLMHENDLAALYIDDLVARLRANGWEIISAEEAYTDPIAATEPNTLTLGQGRVIALAIDSGYQGETRMGGRSENPGGVRTTAGVAVVGRSGYWSAALLGSRTCWMSASAIVSISSCDRPRTWYRPFTMSVGTPEIR